MVTEASARREIIRHALVALAYGAVFVLLRQVSFSHWVLFAGLRLCMLLFVPTRYWAALAIGEMVPLAWTAIPYGHLYGWIWAVLYTMPPIALAMPVVRWCLRRTGMLRPGTPVASHLGDFLLCTVLASVVWTATNLATMAVTRLPAGYVPPTFGELAARWFLGNYIGVLTIVPLLLALRDVAGRIPPSRWREALNRSQMLPDVILLLLPALALLGWLAMGATGQAVAQVARMSMFLPVAWLALRQGWYGAAIGGASASLAVVLTKPSIADVATMQGQVFIAFTITTMLLLGGRITALRLREQREQEEVRRALALAQRNVQLGELQLRQMADAIEEVRESVQGTFGLLLERLRHLPPSNAEREYRRRAAITQQQLFRLADSLYPVAWRDSGVEAALRSGSIARALDECGVRYWCEVDGPGLESMAGDVRLSLYRLVCEAVASACASRHVSDITVRVRTMMLGGQRCAVLRVDSATQADHANHVRREDLLLRLSSSGLGLDAIRDRVEAFQGKVRVRSRGAGERLSLLLRNPA